MLLGRRRLGRLLRRVLLGLLLLTAVLLAFKDRFVNHLVPASLQEADSLLWVIAHPDDESFFFAPAILNLLHGPKRGALLCLSIGDHDGMGPTRREELKRSCARLGIEADRCEALDSLELPDNPGVWWPAPVIEREVLQRVKDWGVDTIFTFDGYGVSGHANHRATAVAIREMVRRAAMPPVYAVHSTSVVAKFTSVLLLPWAVIRHVLAADSERKALFINTWSQYGRALDSFRAHESQARWFRTLFIYFSRYMWYIRADRVS